MRSREAAYRALEAWRKRGARPDMVIANLASSGELDERETALAANITNGVLQNAALCDYYLTAVSTRALSGIEPAVRDILRMAVYQMVFLDRVPLWAAVSEGVKLAKAHAPKASGLVNAVLRRAAERADSMPEVTAAAEAERFSIEYSHPLWLVEEFISSFGAESAEQILKADNMPSPDTLQVNTLRCSFGDALHRLREDGADVEPHPIQPDGILYNGKGRLDKLTPFTQGFVWVQDAAAHLAVCAAEPKPGMTVMDVCSAPGGKAFAAAVMMNNQGKIISSDIHDKKLSLVRKGAERLGIDIITTMAADASKFNDAFEGAADVVIADVPCSGFGVIAKKPEIRYKTSEETLPLIEVQRRIINNVSRYVKPGGVLLYSTCTLLKRENEDIVTAFLSENSNFEAESFTLPEPFGKVESGMTTMLPQQCGTDGFFICRMRRKK